MFFIQWRVKGQVHESNSMAGSFWLLSTYLLRFHYGLQTKINDSIKDIKKVFIDTGVYIC
ncbi:hypothetical protein A4R26_02445 [Niastella populi]|uniref:Uncharacterized protein n=1 Tax=Niastella populi TaxID=550983 RepID=A0A1V9FJ13_9BACT|nr:hypothetical protein A4R26_02445 [Niastella populi]